MLCPVSDHPGVRISTPAETHAGARTDEMHRAPGVCLRDLRAEHLCAVDGRAGCGHARDEDLRAKHGQERTQTASGDGRRTSLPLASSASRIPRQWVTCNGAIEGPRVTVSKPRRPWQNTMGFFVATSERWSARESFSEAREEDGTHLLLMFSRCSWAVLPVSSSLRIGFRSLPGELSGENQLRIDSGSCGKLNDCAGADVCMLRVRWCIDRSDSSEEDVGGELLR